MRNEAAGFDPREDKPEGWAIRVNGVLSIRTASYRPEAAMINALVLLGGLDPWITGHWTDAMIRKEFAALAEREDLQLVSVCLVVEHRDETGCLSITGS